MIEEERLDRGPKRRLVALDGDDTVAPTSDDLLDDLLLAAHGVDRDERAVQVDLLQELRDGGDLIGLGVGGHLSQCDPLLAGPGADDVQGAEVLGPVVRAATGLAVDSDEASGVVGIGPDRIADPRLETPLERLGLQRDEEAPDAVA